jgi:hypothetical protein
MVSGSWLLLVVWFRRLGVIQVCRCSTLLNGGLPSPTAADGTGYLLANTCRSPAHPHSLPLL